MDNLFWVSNNQVLSDGCPKDNWIIYSFFLLLLCNRRRVGLTVFFMGAILYALFLAVFSHYLYCGHYFKADNINFVNKITHNTEVFEVSETNKINSTISRFFQFLAKNLWICWLSPPPRSEGRNGTKPILALNLEAKHFSRHGIAVSNLINSILSMYLTLGPF